MSSYRKTMREVREEMLQSLNENNLEKMRKAAGGAKQTLKMKDGSIGMDSFTASAIMQIYDKVNDKNKKTMENLLKDGKKADIVKLMKFAMSKVNAEYVPEEFEEEFELDEAKYELYHKDFSSAMQHAYKMAKKLHGITISPDEISDKVATGPRKPSEGKTNKYRLEGDKGGIQIQVYNKGGSKPFELNMYKEEVELDEDIGALIFGGGIIAALLPVLFMAVREIIRGTPLESSIKKIVDKLKKNKNYKMSDSEKSDVKGFVSKVKKEKPSLLQKVMKQAKLNLLKDEVELDEAEDFKPHKMYDPETGEAHDAKTMEDHLRMKKMGYSHDKPEVKESGEINEILPAILGVAARAALPAVAGAMMNKKKEKKEKTESAASDARRAMAADPSTKQRFSKNVSATDDDVKAADKNIMMQMRKAVSLRGNKVEFMDKKKVEIPQKVAQAVLDKYNSQKKPADKEKFQAKVSKSYKSMLTALKEQNEINNKNKSLHELKSLVREMKGNNNG